MNRGGDWRLRVLAAEGWTQAAIAERLGISQASVSRRLAEIDAADDHEPEHTPISDALAALLTRRVLDGRGRLAAAEAFALAQKADELTRTPTAAAALALTSVGRRLEELRDQLVTHEPDALDDLAARYRARRAQARTAGDYE